MLPAAPPPPCPLLPYFACEGTEGQVSKWQRAISTTNMAKTKATGGGQGESQFELPPSSVWMYFAYQWDAPGFAGCTGVRKQRCGPARNVACFGNLFIHSANTFY